MSTLSLQIARVRIDLVLPEPEPASLGRYRPFASAEGPAGWSVEVRPEPAAGTATAGLAVVEHERRWTIGGSGQAGWVDPASRTGVVRGDPGTLFLDAFLRCIVGTEVLARGGLAVHGAAVVVDGAAHVFPARSGSGKSTLAARASHPLSDEVTVIVPSAGSFQVHATPWWMSRGGAAPLAGIYALAWGGEGVAPLRQTAVRQIVTNLVLPLDTPANRGRGLAAAAAVAGAVRFARFDFRPDSDVDALLRAASG